jgi:hypothetical protein
VQGNGHTLKGCITAIALASDDVMSFNFVATHSGAGILAAAASGVASGGPVSQQSRRQVDADLSLLPGSMLWLPAGDDSSFAAKPREQ